MACQSLTSKRGTVTAFRRKWKAQAHLDSFADLRLDVPLCTPGEEPERPAQLSTFAGGPLIRCDSQKPPGEKSKRFARLILRRLSAYCLQMIWNWNTLFRGSGRAAEKPAALRGPAAGGKIPSGPELGSTFRIDAFLVLRQSQRQR